MAMEVSLQALPFLFPENQRDALRQWRAAAVRKERELAARRQARLQELKEYVQRRLKELESTLPLSSGGNKQPLGHSVPEGEVGVATGKAIQEEDMGHVESGTGSVHVKDHATYASLESQRKYVSSFSRPVTSGSVPYCRPQPPDKGWPPSGMELVSQGKPSLSPRRRLFPPEGRCPRDSSATVRQDPYVKLTAIARGFLTRRLLHSDKVNHYVQLIKDASAVLSSLQEPSGDADIAFRERVTTQLQLARLNLHEIFFDLPVEERMAFIAHSRVLQQQRSLRRSGIPRPRTVSLPPPTGISAPPATEPIASTTRGKLSSATLKAMERRKRENGAHLPKIAGHRNAVRSESKKLETSSMNDKKAVKPDKPVAKLGKPVSSKTVTSTTRYGGEGGGRVKGVTKSGRGLRARGKENHQDASTRLGASKSGSKYTGAK